MRTVVLSMIAAACLSMAGPVVAMAGDQQAAPYSGSKEFERMKRLVGSWEGTSDMGKEGEKVRVEYRLTSGGSALVETLAPGSGNEMVSVYHDRQGKLAMTHYCTLRNQPLLTLAKADDKALELVFAGSGNDIDAAKEKHMHAVSVTFTDNDHIVQKWTHYDKGKDAGVVTLKLMRVR